MLQFSVKIERRDKLKVGCGEVGMSLASERESWLDRWWQVLVILFGLIFVACLVSFKPGI